jgi:cytochrome c oxidase subunit I+III
VVCSLALGAAAFTLTVAPQLAAAIDPQASAYGAIVWTLISYQGAFGAVLLVMAAFVIARIAAGLLDANHRAPWDSLRLLWHCGAVQGALVVVLLAAGIHLP